MNGQFSSLDEFWPFYLSQHLNPATRRLHFIGTTLGLIFLALAAVLRAPRISIAAFVAAYGCAWIGHFFFERNAPATFRHPLLSLRADFRMYRLMWTGGLAVHLLERTSRDLSAKVRTGRPEKRSLPG
jgi:hypothetical protein